MALITGLTALLWAAGAAAQEPGHRKLPLSSLSTPAYQPTKKPSSGGCRDDESWRYNAGDKGEKGCDHVASEPDKVVKRCVNRKSDDGVWAYEACPKTCGTCGNVVAPTMKPTGYAPTYKPTIGERDGSVLCPGVPPGTNQFCDCSGDCREKQDEFCFCAEARAEGCCDFAAPSESGCEDDPKWLYDAGDKGEKGCDHIASEKDKVEKRCLERMSDDGVPAYEACQLTCGTCSFSLHGSDMTYKKCKKACEKKGLRMPCITSKAVDEALESAIKLGGDYYGWIAYNDKDTEGDFAWEDGCTSSYTNWDAGPPQEPNNDPNFGGEDCTIKWNDGTTWNDVPCDFTYPCYCQDVKGGGY